MLDKILLSLDSDPQAASVLGECLLWVEDSSGYIPTQRALKFLHYIDILFFRHQYLGSHLVKIYREGCNGDPHVFISFLEDLSSRRIDDVEVLKFLEGNRSGLPKSY